MPDLEALYKLDSAEQCYPVNSISEALAQQLNLSGLELPEILDPESICSELACLIGPYVWQGVPPIALPVSLLCGLDWSDTPTHCYQIHWDEELEENRYDEVNCYAAEHSDLIPDYCERAEGNGSVREVDCLRERPHWNQIIHMCNEMVLSIACVGARVFGEPKYEIPGNPQGAGTCGSAEDNADDPMFCAAPRSNVGVTSLDYSNILNSTVQFAYQDTSTMLPVLWSARENPYVTGSLAGERTNAEDTIFERMRALRPSLVLATAAINHVLGSPTKIGQDLSRQDFGRFLLHAGLTFEGLRDTSQDGFPDVQGGLVYGIPPVESLDYYRFRNEEDARRDCGEDLSHTDLIRLAGYVPFWRTPNNPDLFSTSSCNPDNVLDPAEKSVLDTFILAYNEQLREWAKENHYTFLDLHQVLTCMVAEGELAQADGHAASEARQRYIDFECDAMYPRANGDTVGIKDLTSFDLFSPSLGRAFNGRVVSEIPAQVLWGWEGVAPFEIGMTGLDGIHLNRFGHALVAKLAVEHLNEYYGLDLAEGGKGERPAGEHGIWWMEDVLTDSLITTPAPVDDVSLFDYWSLINSNRLASLYPDFASALTLFAEEIARLAFDLANPFIVQGMFSRVIDDVIPKEYFRQRAEQMSEPIGHRCLSLEKLEDLGLSPDNNPYIDRCAICCEGGEQECWGSDQCPEIE